MRVYPQARVMSAVSALISGADMRTNPLRPVRADTVRTTADKADNCRSQDCWLSKMTRI